MQQWLRNSRIWREQTVIAQVCITHFGIPRVGIGWLLIKQIQMSFFVGASKYNNYIRNGPKQNKKQRSYKPGVDMDQSLVAGAFYLLIIVSSRCVSFTVMCLYMIHII